MITGLHFLLTYRCTHACDHCFVFGSPRGRGAFTLRKVREVLAQARDVGTIESVYFEGGEPFLHYPVLLAGLRAAKDEGYEVGVVTNAYWAESVEDAELWLKPLAEIGIADLTLSDDDLHGETGAEGRAQTAVKAAKALGISVGTICLPPVDEGKGVRFRGRAADNLTEGRPVEPARTFDRCPDEDFVNPGRVHLDGLGNVHLCQGVLLGNVWETPLAELLRRYDPHAHPVTGPLLRGGPAALAEEHGIEPWGEWADACHLCFEVRRRLRERLSAELGPDQVYGEPS
jgi:hypothetical protein